MSYPVLRFVKIVSLIVFVVFSFSILTVEYNQGGNKGSLRSRCPTCIESNIELAVRSIFANDTEFYLSSGFISNFEKSTNSGILATFRYVCRGPPFLSSI
ncbi:MAG: hypothetical protein N2745_00915 [Syntrophorhabdaceae bacterium]|nr:hypothetical protein [Syntrophorhabdaceae bacterium]